MICSNHMMKLKTGEYWGNFIDKEDNVGKKIRWHFSPDSFMMWLKKSDSNGFFIRNDGKETLCTFQFEGMEHQMESRIKVDKGE